MNIAPRQSKLRPAILGRTTESKHQDFEKIGDATSLSGVRVEISQTTKPHLFTTSEGDGIISRRLRRYGLSLSRYSVPPAKYHKKWRLSQQAIQAANNYISAVAYRGAYNDDHTVGTYSPDPLISLISQEQVPPGAFMEALTMFGTVHWEKIYGALMAYHPELSEQLETAISCLTPRSEEHNGWVAQSANDVIRSVGEATSGDPSDPWTKRRSKWRRTWHSHIAKFFDEYARSLSADTGSDGGRRQRRTEDGEIHTEQPPIDNLSQRWGQLVLSKPVLELPHSGKMGRKIIGHDTGRFPRFLNRLVTDPKKRIFSRKTRSLGAVVIIDCSGSMCLSQDDVEQLVESSAGASVLCYSGNSRNVNAPNAWLVAKNGRQSRSLPRFPGGNVVDGPALMWAVTNLRRSSRSPIVWISDGWVTGQGDRSSADLRDEVERIKKKYRIKQVGTATEATEYLSQLQRKGIKGE